MKNKDLQPRLLSPAKLSFRMEGQTKCFLDKVKLKEFIIAKPLLYEMLKGLIYEIEEDQKLWTVKWQQTHNYQQLYLKNKNKIKNKLSKQPEQNEETRIQKRKKNKNKKKRGLGTSGTTLNVPASKS